MRDASLSQRKLWRVGLSVLALHVLALWGLSWGLMPEATQWVQQRVNLVQVVADVSARPEPTEQVQPSPAAPAQAMEMPVPPPAVQTAPLPPSPQALSLPAPEPSKIASVQAPPAVVPNAAAQALPATAARPAAKAAVKTAPVVSASGCVYSKDDYPAASRRLEEEGVVILRLLVGEDGRVLDSVVDKSSGLPRLDEAARRLSKERCRAKPATIDGQAVREWVRLAWRWELGDE